LGVLSDGKEETVEEVWVLFVDDDPMKLMLVKPLIESYDPLMHVDTMSEPRKVVEAVQRFDYDCVISEYIVSLSHDINIFKSVKNVKPIPTILYTVREYEEVAKVAQASGVNGYYMKVKDPRYYPALIRFIREIIKRYRVGNPRRKYRNDPRTTWQVKSYQIMKSGTESVPV
jgi:DNA-binding NarL/FixJ family response regulator